MFMQGYWEVYCLFDAVGMMIQVHGVSNLFFRRCACFCLNPVKKKFGTFGVR